MNLLAFLIIVFSYTVMFCSIQKTALQTRHNTQEEFLICFFSFNRSKPRLSIFISRDLAQVLSEPENLMGGREGGGVLHSC